MIDALPKYEAKLGRHGHNLSHNFSFTSSTGHLLTVFDDLLLPGDTISGNIEMFTRTQPLNTPANVEVEEYIDYFFVPLQMLWSPIGDLLMQVKEPYSSWYNNQLVSTNNLPVYDFTRDFNALVSQATIEQGYYGYIISNEVDPYGFDWGFFSKYRCFEHNGINPNCFCHGLSDDDNDSVYPLDNYQPKVFPYTLLAYNCVYQHFYRLDDREQFNNKTYNVDNDLVNNEISNINTYLYYRPLHFDYFTSSKVSPLINPLNVLGNNTSLSAINNYLSEMGVLATGVSGDEATSELKTNYTQVKQVSEDFVSTSTLRSMFAVEKLLSVTNRAKKTYDAQVLAHYGFKVPHDVKHEISYLGTQRATLRVGEVIATAGTADTPLGDMAGKGYSSMDGKVIKFTAPCHGVFIGIYSCVPRVSYYAPLTKRHVITNRLDLPIPEFEKLGMQPLFRYEVLAENDMLNFILGWQMRYDQFKRRFDKVSSAFAKTYFIDTNFGDIWHFNPNNLSFNNFSSWVISNRPYQNYVLTAPQVIQNDISSFLCSPSMLNDIMSIKYGWYPMQVDIETPIDWDSFENRPKMFKFSTYQDGSIQVDGLTHNMSQLFYRDPLLHFAKCNFKKVSWMSDNTLPDLI